MKKITTIDVKLSTILKILISLGLAWIILQLHPIVIVLFIAFIVATAVRPIVKKLEEYKIPKTVSTPVVYLLLLAILIGLISIVIEPLAKELTYFGKDLPQVLNSIQDKFPFLSNLGLPKFSSNLSSSLLSSGQDLNNNLGAALKAITGIFDVFTSIVTIIIISLYLSLDLDNIIKRLLRFIPKENREITMGRYIKVEDQVGAWVRGELFLMLFIGIVMFILLKLLDVPFALPLAVFSGLMEILPIVGPLVYSVAIILVALTVSPLTAILSIIGCLAIQQAEAHILVPLTMKKAVGLSPVTTIVAILAGASLLGVVGALIAVPLAAVLVAIITDIYAAD